MLRTTTEERRPSRIAVVLVCLLPVVVIGLVVAGALAGLRLFVVESPSMGTAAPVGSLVVDAPLAAEPVDGEIVTYRPPMPGAAPITHRVVAVDGDAIRTRGDINGMADAWTTPDRSVIGRPVAILPGVGWLFRALPYLIGGLLPVVILSRFLRSPIHRAAARMLGVSVVVASVVALLRPLLNATVLTTGITAGKVVAQVVSTGLLPIRVSAGSVAVHLGTGQVGTLTLPPSDSGRYDIATALDVGPLGWVLLGAACAVPVLWTLAVGPTRVDDDTAR